MWREKLLSMKRGGWRVWGGGCVGVGVGWGSAKRERERAGQDDGR